MKSKIIDRALVIIMIALIPLAFLAGDWANMGTPVYFTKQERHEVSFEDVVDPKPNYAYYEKQEHYLVKKRGVFPFTTIDTIKTISIGVIGYDRKEKIPD